MRHGDHANPEPHPASFRDPSGFVYVVDGVVYRRVNRQYQESYDRLMASGLYDALVTEGWMVAHDEVPVESPAPDEAYRILKPVPIPYVSYPYEWSFSQLKDAALLTLDIQMRSLASGMTLKDASAYNVQFIGSRPTFIDTLSFDTYEEGRPWVAYRQFCQHFLAPLALMACVDVRLGHLLRNFIDGLPLDLVSTLLPVRTRMRFGLLVHIHAHARSQKRHERGGRTTAARAGEPRLSKPRLLALLDSLRRTVAALTLPRMSTEWGDYYEDTNYSSDAMAAKEAIVGRMVEAFVPPGETIHDLGANTGRFSRLVAGAGRYVVSHDIDALAVERNYLRNRSERIADVLPLLLDLTNPSPSIGWALAERASTLARLRGSVVALALVHHLAISNNVPLPRLAAFFACTANTLVVEFVPKEDSQVQRLLATRADVFPHYTQAAFEAAFQDLFEVLARERVPGTTRTLYAMRRRS